MLLVKRRGRDAFEARFLCPVWFYEFAGARDADVSDRLARAFAEDRGEGVRSIRTDRHAERPSLLVARRADGVSRAERLTSPFETKGK